jgi:hypothetical protein
MAVFTSWTITHQPLLGELPKAVPSSVVVGEMDEGACMVSGLRGLELPLQVVIEALAEGIRLPFFGPRSNGSRRP